MGWHDSESGPLSSSLSAPASPVPPPLIEDELFQIVESDHKDTCHVWCVNSKCRVYALDEYESRGEAAKTEKGVILPVSVVSFSAANFLCLRCPGRR